MMNAALPARLILRQCFALGAVLALLLGGAELANAQGLVKGVQEGAAAGNKAAGPVGGVLGGAIGGVIGFLFGRISIRHGGADGFSEMAVGGCLASLLDSLAGGG